MGLWPRATDKVVRSESIRRKKNIEWQPYPLNKYTISFILIICILLSNQLCYLAKMIHPRPLLRSGFYLLRYLFASCTETPLLHKSGNVAALSVWTEGKSVGMNCWQKYLQCRQSRNLWSGIQRSCFKWEAKEFVGNVYLFFFYSNISSVWFTVPFLV